ncbi:hypothetical protein BBJ28_00016103 [Nothophytophthora sp. Chile5]|nr:hypothetical protein BBJ28_00016103 [Nothophytophthora sp. Chile5]
MPTYWYFLTDLQVPSNAEENTRELQLMRQREYDAKSLKKKRLKKRMLILELAMLEEAAFAIVARKLLEQTTNPAFFCCYDARRDSQCPVRLMDIVRSFISSWGRLATIRAVAAESAALSPRWEFYCQLDAVVTELETQNWGALSDL